MGIYVSLQAAAFVLHLQHASSFFSHRKGLFEKCAVGILSMVIASCTEVCGIFLMFMS